MSKDLEKSKKPKKKKKYKNPLDEHGNWVEEHNRLVSGLRKVFRLHPIMKEVLQEVRVELPPKILKNGSVGKKIQVRFRCKSCGELFSTKNVNVDHIEPMIPLDIESKDMSLDEIWERLRCSKSNLQVLCSTKKKNLPKGQLSCHTLKTSRENYIRDGFKNYKSNPNTALFSTIKGKESKFIVDFFSRSYDAYLKLQKEELEAKEERKRLRELKKKAK